MSSMETELREDWDPRVALVGLSRVALRNLMMEAPGSVAPAHHE
jgi:hypothetical protein